jgi:chlorite dismutase
VVAFESDKPGDFVDLVMALRETEGSRFTLRDTPIITCIRKPIHETLDDLG